MKANRTNTMAIVVDIQERILPAMHNHELLADKANRLMTGLKLLDVPILITQQYTKGLGMSMPFVFEAEGTQEYMDKMAFSAMGDEAIANKVKELDRKNVLVFGIEAHVCVLQTCLDLKELGYQPILVLDCISSRKESDIEMAKLRAIQEDIIVTSYEAILFELLEKASGDAFKAISKLVR